MSPHIPVPPFQDSFVNASSTFFHDSKFSDFTVICGTTGKKFKVHRFLVSSQSKWFDRCCSGRMSESKTQEATLKEDRPEALERMIEYFYKFSYNEYLGTSTDDTSTIEVNEGAPKSFASLIQLHAHMYAIADKYEVADLQKYALSQYYDAVQEKKTNTECIVAAVSMLTDDLELQDKVLLEILVDAWCNVPKAQLVDLDKSKLNAFLSAYPEFNVEVQMRLLAARHDASIRVHNNGTW